MHWHWCLPFLYSLRHCVGVQQSNAIRKYGWEHHWDIDGKGPMQRYSMLWVRSSATTNFQEALNRCLAAKCSCSQCRRHEKVLVIIIPLIEAPAILQDRTQPCRTIGLLWHKQASRLGMIIIGGTEGAFYQIAQTHLHAMCTCVLAQILKLSSPATGSFQSDPSWNSGRVCKVDLYPSSSQFVYFLS